jgi:hypothetical protein
VVVVKGFKNSVYILNYKFCDFENLKGVVSKT